MLNGDLKQLGLKVKCQVIFTEQFAFNGNKYVKIQGKINNLGLFQQTVREDLIPDNLEGKNCTMVFTLGVDSKLKPYLKFSEIIIENGENK